MSWYGGIVKKIGIFGGTFDPIHHGHLILAREALERLELEAVIFVPAATSPHKIGAIQTDAKLRVEMLLAATRDHAGFSIDTLELDRPPPSYAIDTVKLLKSRDPDASFLFLIGEDNVARLETWHHFDELSKVVEFVVLDRTGLKSTHPYRTVGRHLDISATDIRNRVARGQSIRYLVPRAVEQIIHEQQLYLEPSSSPPKI